MYLAIRARNLIAALAASALVAIASTATAQEIADSHLKAARSAVAAVGVTEEFDNILPQAAQALKAELIQKNPDLVEIITTVVDEETLGMASRRGDLEREVAVIYAKIFTEQQLNEITQFYTSETGKKMLADAGLVARQVYEAANIWQRGVARDLAQSVGTKISEITNANAANNQAAQDGEAGQANN